MQHDYQDDIDAIEAIDAVAVILDVVCRTTGMGFAAVARVTEARWIACKVDDRIGFGLKPGGELVVSTTICNEIRQSGEAVVIDHVTADDVYCGHPTPAQYGFQSYISMPIFRRDGSFFGTLCAIDPQPARLKNTETIGMFKLFAQLIASQLDAAEEVAAARRRLLAEQKNSELRDQFIAVLGHDLKNPIASINAGARLLLTTPLDAKATSIVKLMQGSVVRMNGLVDNVLDFARARLGGGMMLDRRRAPLEPVLRQVIDELQAVNPGRHVEVSSGDLSEVEVDQLRMAQLLSNLLANALTHGAPDQPVRVDAAVKDGALELSVTNGGDPIPQAERDALFLPFSRGHVSPDRQGLGLGLYIASEIAKAHDGELTVSSSPEETRFTFRMPMQ